jgi:hypothetical protein
MDGQANEFSCRYIILFHYIEKIYGFRIQSSFVLAPYLTRAFLHFCTFARGEGRKTRKILKMSWLSRSSSFSEVTYILSKTTKINSPQVSERSPGENEQVSK